MGEGFLNLPNLHCPSFEKDEIGTTHGTYFSFLPLLSQLFLGVGLGWMITKFFLNLPNFPNLSLSNAFFRLAQFPRFLIYFVFFQPENLNWTLIHFADLFLTFVFVSNYVYWKMW